MRWLALAFLSLLAFPAAAQTGGASNVASLANPKVTVTTTEGAFVVEVRADKAPISAANFLKYVDGKRLDGATFYRVVKVQDRFGFVQFGLQNDPKKILPPIKHEPTTQTGLRHLDGTLSMPRHKPGTAQGEFTIMLGEQASYDANPEAEGDNLGFAAFAQVVEGMDVVLKVFDAPVSPTATLRGGTFAGQVPEKPVKIISARRLTASQ